MKLLKIIGVVFIGLVAILGLYLVVTFFVVSPFEVQGMPIKAFDRGEIVWIEKISYKFNEPAVGDNVIFLPKDRSQNLIGTIEKIDIQDGYTLFSITSSGDYSHIVKLNEIKGRIFYPPPKNTQ